LDELFPAERERIVKLLVQEVVVSKDGLLIRLRLHGLNSLVAELVGASPAEGAAGRVVPGTDGQTVDVRVPMEFKVRGGRKEIIVPPDAATAADVGPRSPLVVALARGTAGNRCWTTATSSRWTIWLLKSAWIGRTSAGP
jgi:hypothetical protein